MREYSIGEVAKMLDISIATIRYYDDYGLLPLVKRDKSGHRIFTEQQIGIFQLLLYLRDTGMSLEVIKQYIDYFKRGLKTAPERLAMLEDHEAKVLAEITEKKRKLAGIQSKMAKYRQFIADGTGLTDVVLPDKE